MKLLVLLISDAAVTLVFGCGKNNWYPYEHHQHAKFERYRLKKVSKKIGRKHNSLPYAKFTESIICMGVILFMPVTIIQSLNLTTQGSFSCTFWSHTKPWNQVQVTKTGAQMISIIMKRVKDLALVNVLLEKHSSLHGLTYSNQTTEQV